MVDFHTGSHLATAILAGILGAQRNGKGCDVDVSLFDTALHQLSYPATWYLNQHHVTGRLPRGAHPSIAPSQLVRTKDGWGLLMCQTPKFWDLFCQIAKAGSLATDPRFKSIASRRANLAALTEAVDEVLSAQTTSEWMDALGGNVPFAPVLGIGEALENPYVSEIEMIETVAHPARDAGLRTLASPFRVNGKRPVSSRSPLMGEQDEDLLT
jgi:crotonobetainyl-CoA:carnitine CoA-transferase CaiB-like acyl-CoA transferase